MADFENLVNTLWIEKYRPKDFSDVIMNDAMTKFFEKCYSEMSIPHLMLVGKPGSGKTTLARIICDKFITEDEDKLCINGSNSRGIDTIRDIEDYLKSPPHGDCKHKIVFIDEADNLTPDAFKNLRGVMEAYYENGRFIFTGNDTHKFPDAIKSRCQAFELREISVDFILRHCTRILMNEHVVFQEGHVRSIIEALSPDVRKIINVLEQNVFNGELINVDPSKLRSNINNISAHIIRMCSSMNTKNSNYLNIVNSCINEIYKLLNEQEPDYVNLYTFLFNSENVPVWVKPTINKYMNQHQYCAVSKINFMAMCYDFVEAGTRFMKIV